MLYRKPHKIVKVFRIFRCFRTVHQIADEKIWDYELTTNNWVSTFLAIGNKLPKGAQDVVHPGSYGLEFDAKIEYLGADDLYAYSRYDGKGLLIELQNRALSLNEAYKIGRTGETRDKAIFKNNYPEIVVSTRTPTKIIYIPHKNGDIPMRAKQFQNYAKQMHNIDFPLYPVRFHP